MQRYLKAFESVAYMHAKMDEAYLPPTRTIGMIFAIFGKKNSCVHFRIRKYDFENQREETLIQEASQIMFFTVDKEERYCLVTTKTEGIRLWCLKTITLIRTFFGANHTDFVSFLLKIKAGIDNKF